MNFILNSSLVVQLDDATRRTIYNFLRRAEAAFREYSSARQMTLAHLANPNPDAVSEYIIAIGHWEVFLSHAYQAWYLLVRRQKILFAPGGGFHDAATQPALQPHQARWERDHSRAIAAGRHPAGVAEERWAAQC